MQENEDLRENEGLNTQPVELPNENSEDENNSEEKSNQDNLQANTTTELNEEQMLTKMQELLSKNASWLEQVKMSLFAIYHLHKSHKDIKEKYEFVLSECVRIKEELIRSVDEFKIFLDTDKKEFLKMKIS